MRAFIAITLPEAIRDALSILQQDLASVGADVKWVAHEQLHITLKFLEEVSEPQRVEVEELLRRVARDTTPFTAQLNRVGAFPTVTSPRILWVGVGSGGEPIARMAAAIEEGARRAALPQEDRAFSAHVTLGRVRSARGQAELVKRLRETAWQPPAPWEVTALTLYQSVLNRSGPSYAVLAEIPLGNAGK